MEVTVESAEFNPVMDRHEITLKLEHESEPTPSGDDVVSRFAAEENISEDSIDIRKIHTGFGSQISQARVFASGDVEISSVEKDESSEDYSDLLSGTVSEVKDAIEDLEDPDWQALKEAEIQGKNRKTLKDWIEKNAE